MSDRILLCKQNAIASQAKGTPWESVHRILSLANKRLFIRLVFGYERKSSLCDRINHR